MRKRFRWNATDQQIHASGRAPIRARTQLAMISFTWPTARQEVEAADRARWLGLLVSLLTATPIQSSLPFAGLWAWASDRARYGTVSMFSDGSSLGWLMPSFAELLSQTRLCRAPMQPPRPSES